MNLSKTTEGFEFNLPDGRNADVTVTRYSDAIGSVKLVTDTTKIEENPDELEGYSITPLTTLEIRDDITSWFTDHEKWVRESREAAAREKLEKARTEAAQDQPEEKS